MNWHQFMAFYVLVLAGFLLFASAAGGSVSNILVRVGIVVVLAVSMIYAAAAPEEV